MKKISVPALLLAVLLLLAGCSSPWLSALAGRFGRGDGADAMDTVSVWRTAAEPGGGGELLREEPYPAAVAQEAEELLALFASPSQDASLACALPPGVAVQGWTLEKGVLTLELSEEYLALSEMDRTIAAFSAALTLCQLEGVEAVTVTAGGQTVFSGLMPEDALLSAADTDPYVRQLRLYFPDSGGRWLLTEYHSLTLDEDTSPERYVIEELLRGPNNGELQSVLPADTTLLSCATGEDGVCTVDFSRAFYDNRPDTALGERLVLYALVDSLTALSTVDSVRILVEGRPLDTYVFRSLAEPLSRYDEAVGPVSTPKGESDRDLYLVLPGLEAITPLPFRVDESDYDSAAEAVLAALLSAEEPGYPAIFSGSASVITVTAQGDLCTVDLSESFFASLPERARTAAVQSVAATLCALPDIRAVRFTVGGNAAVFDGVDWSGPWNEFSEIEVN